MHIVRAPLLCCFWMVPILWATGCSVAPRTMADPNDLPPAQDVLLRGVIVDANPDGGVLVVKDQEERVTWTVALRREATIRSHDGVYLTVRELPVGGTVDVRGESRIEGVMSAAEVTLLRNPPSP